MASVEWPVIGIDFGTTSSCVAVWDQSGVTVIPNELGDRTTPSCVAFSGNGRLIGEEAVLQARKNPTNTIFDVKRLIGRRLNDHTLKKDIELYLFKVINDVDHGIEHVPRIAVDYMGEEIIFTPVEISAMILAKMKAVAENYLSCSVKNAVVSVPAYFNDSQRRATKDAGTIAGLNVVRIINAPTATAMVYGLDMKINEIKGAKKNVMFVDLGGGTLDVSLVKIGKDEINVIATSGDTHLGGTDFEERMLDECLKKFEEKNKLDISKNPKAIGRLRDALGKAKRLLSLTPQTDVEIECISQEIDFRETITREQFENWNMDLFSKCIDIISRCMKDAGIEKSNVHDVVFVGGSSKIPKVRQILKEFFGKELCKSIHPEESVAAGAAMHGAILAGIRITNKDIVLKDVTPLIIGTYITPSDFLSEMIHKNTTIPIQVKHTFRKYNPQHFRLVVYEVDDLDQSLNILGELERYGCPAASRNRPTQFHICFDMDVDGILSATIMKEAMQIDMSSHHERLSREEIGVMIQKFKKYSAHDQKQSDLRKVRSDLESYAEGILELSETDSGGRKIQNIENMKKAAQKTVKWLKQKSDLSEVSTYEDQLKKLKTICDAPNKRGSMKDAQLNNNLIGYHGF